VTNAIIKAVGVCKTVPTIKDQLSILKDVSFEVISGQSIAIVGPSGAGKSTLLGLLAGLDLPSSGQIYLADREITSLDEEQRATVRADLVGFVFQTFQLLDSLTALDNVSLPMELSGNPKSQQLAKEFLAKVGLPDRLLHYPKQLSGGEQQRVAIARAFACQPKILFADEPTGNLDQATGEKVTDLLFDMNHQSDTTLVLVTHDQKLASRCDRTIVIDGGQLISH